MRRSKTASKQRSQTMRCLFLRRVSKKKVRNEPKWLKGLGLGAILSCAAHLELTQIPFCTDTLPPWDVFYGESRQLLYSVF